MAGLRWFAAMPGSVQKPTGKETKEEILKDAIRRSNETIIFYQGLKDFAKGLASEDVIGKLIREENRHIQLINEQLKQLK